jgi:actin-like ATPase involved in cell morphogenesis
MGYHLGVDLGTTYTAAAVRRDGVVSVLGLGNRAMQIPSMVYLQSDGTFLVGEAAEARAGVEPDRIAREFKRRIGDPVPIIVGGAPFSAEQLTARLLSSVVAVATEREGAPPESVTVSYPANWGTYKTDLLRQTFALANLNGVRTCTEPEAAALTYATRHRVQQGTCVAVYDLGGGTFDAAVLRDNGDAFALVGEPEGIEHLGGVDFDEAVFQHVLRTVGPELATVDGQDPAVLRGLERLRRDCVAAKESLSTDTEAAIAVNVGHVDTVVRLTRSEFEDLIRPSIDETIASLRRVLSSAGVPPEQLTAILLVGGSSRIPLVSEMLSGAFGRPLALDAHPKHDIAIGAAWFGVPLVEASRPPVAAAPGRAFDDAPTTPLPGRGHDAGGPPWLKRSRSSWLAVGAVGAVAVLATGAGLWLTSGSPSHHGQASSGSHGTPTGVAPTSSASSGSPASAAPQRPEGQPLPTDVVIWAAVRHGAEQIWQASVDDPQHERAFFSRPHSRSPALSHDRKTIAYIDDSGDGSTLHLIGTDGQDDRALFQAPQPKCAEAGGRPAFSPDDTQLAVMCEVPPGPDTWALYLVDVSGRTLRGPLDTGNMGDPTYRPDGGAVAYWKSGTVDGKQNAAIFEVNTDGAPRPQRLSGWVNANDPTFSPTGTSLALTTLEGTTLQIAVINLASNAMTMLTTDRRNNQDPSWAPDGTQLTYKSGPSLNADIWMMDANGTDQHALITDPGPDSAPAWSAR